MFFSQLDTIFSLFMSFCEVFQPSDTVSLVHSFWESHPDFSELFELPRTRFLIFVKLWPLIPKMFTLWQFEESLGFSRLLTLLSYLISLSELFDNVSNQCDTILKLFWSMYRPRTLWDSFWALWTIGHYPNTFGRFLSRLSSSNTYLGFFWAFWTFGHYFKALLG